MLITTISTLQLGFCGVNCEGFVNDIAANGNYITQTSFAADKRVLFNNCRTNSYSDLGFITQLSTTHL